MLERFLNRFKALIFAALITVVLGVILQTQMVIASLNDLGANIGLGQSLSMTAYDIFYLGKPYGVLILIALLIAFLVGGLVYRFAKFSRPVIYTIAGGTAIFVMLFAMKNVFFGVHLIAGASDTFGILLQIIAGMAGGFVFAHLSRKSALQKTQEKSPVDNEA